MKDVKNGSPKPSGLSLKDRQYRDLNYLRVIVDSSEKPSPTFRNSKSLPRNSTQGGNSLKYMVHPRSNRERSIRKRRRINSYCFEVSPKVE